MNGKVRKAKWRKMVFGFAYMCVWLWPSLPHLILFLLCHSCEGGLMQQKNNLGKLWCLRSSHICCWPSHRWTDSRMEWMAGGRRWMRSCCNMWPWLYHHTGERAKGLKADHLAPSPDLVMPLSSAFVLALVTLASKPSLGLLSLQYNFPESKWQSWYFISSLL